jgi:LCP family protein required for cell wall assembly
MRTTLKRGIGRSAAANGNGRAVLPPAVVELAEPVRRYRQPKVERGFLYYLSVTLGWLIVAILTVAVGLAGGVYLLYHETVSDVRAHTPELKIAQERLDLPLPDAPAIALVVGIDERKKGVDADGTKRSDTLLLLRADPRQRALSMLSFPRDLLVPIQCPHKPTYTDRINQAISYCGTQGALETVKGITGLPINYLITVNFVGFVKLVAELGGVWMDVDQRYYNPEGTGYASIDLHPGYQKLNGRQALDFVRYRHTDSDIYRLARQQRFVHAFKQAAAGSFSISKLLKVVGVVRDNVEIGAKGGRIDGRTIKRWGLFGFDLPPGHVFQTKIDPSCYGETYNYALTVADGCIARAVEDFSRPDVEAAEKATAEALGRKPKVPGPPPEKTTVVVLNGNGVAGAAADASYQLAQKGYQTLEPANGALANAPTQDYARTHVFYDDVDPRAKRAAARMVTLLGGAKDVDPGVMPVAIQPLAGDAMVAVVLGRNFSGTVLGAGTAEAPKRQPPKVVVNPAETRTAVRQARKRVRFPLVLPRVIEETSHLSTLEGVRVYQVGGHKAVRLTFATDRNEYWGIQMVPWRDAPALKGPNEVVKMKGREYALYYSGLKLEMVVLRYAGNTYWVTNTLLDSLSNETMLAIAKGLQPLKPR